MAIDKVVAPLLRVPLFAGLQPLQITEIARQAERIKFRSGDVITKVGTSGDAGYLIVSGEAERRPEPGSFAPPEPIEPGSLVGELAMLIDHVYGATIVACGRVHCLKLTRAAMHDQMHADPALAQHFTRLMNDRLTQIAAELHKIDQMLDEGGAIASDASTTDLQAEVLPARELPALTGTHG